MRGHRGPARQPEWSQERARQGLTEEGRDRRRADIASKAATLARDPVAGAYLFGELAWLLDSRGELPNLAQVADAAEEDARRQAELNTPEPAADPPGPEAAGATLEPEPAGAGHEAA